MTRETTAVKARRLLGDGRLTVVSRNGDDVAASCLGDSGEVYQLGHDAARPGWWRCSCPAPQGRCSHVLALQLVTVPRPEGGRA